MQIVCDPEVIINLIDYSLDSLRVYSGQHNVYTYVRHEVWTSGFRVGSFNAGCQSTCWMRTRVIVIRSCMVRHARRMHAVLWTTHAVRNYYWSSLHEGKSVAGVQLENSCESATKDCGRQGRTLHMPDSRGADFILHTARLSEVGDLIDPLAFLIRHGVRQVVRLMPAHQIWINFVCAVDRKLSVKIVYLATLRSGPGIITWTAGSVTNPTSYEL